MRVPYTFVRGIDTSSRAFQKADFVVRKAETNILNNLAAKKARLFTGSVNNFNPPSNGTHLKVLYSLFQTNMIFSEPIETPEELLKRTNVGPFLEYGRLSTESLNALQNYLRSELLSVAHQLNFLHGHYQASHNHLVAVIRSKLERAELEDGGGLAADDPVLKGLATPSKAGPSVNSEAGPSK